MNETKNKKPERLNNRLRIGPVTALPAGRGANVKLEDGNELALFNVGGKFFAIDNVCPHRGFSLGDSRLYDNIVECDLHGWRFDVRSGECLTESECSLESYKVEIEDGDIFVIV